MDCLLNYIGVKGCGIPEPVSGIYINQLPGIHLKKIDSIANYEQVSFHGVWDDIQSRALSKFVSDFKQGFNERYIGYCCREGCSIDSLICSIKSELTNALLYAYGKELMIEVLYSDRINRYTTVDKEEAKELRDYYQVEYEKSLNIAIKSIPKALLDDCFECNTGLIRAIERLP